jgi:hypothetical protein
MVIIIVLKSNSWVNSGQRLGHGLGGSTQVDVIIIVLKPNSGIDPGQGLGYGLGGSTQVNHTRIKIVIIIILKLTWEST